MSSKKKIITGGLYLVLNPDMDREILLSKLGQSLKGGVDVIQIWNNWPELFTLENKIELIHDVLRTAEDFQVPVLINEEWELLKETALDGVHFDTLRADLHVVRSEIKRDFIFGITCNNDLSVIHSGEKEGADYISFCSMFPSRSVSSCDIVMPENVRKAGEMTDLPIFVSGGITAENLKKLSDLPIDGVAVISGILNSETPEKSAQDYKQILNQHKRKP